MTLHRWFVWAILPLSAASLVASSIAPACCPAPLRGQHVVNADQTVILIWNPDTQTQHFIRQASFKSDARDVGFIIPSPSEPELAESGNNAFDSLAQYTAPKVVHAERKSRGGGFGCVLASRSDVGVKSARVLQEKRVAGFNATVLEADTSEALTTWLTEHGYEFSPAIAAWAEPYIAQGWKFTALKVADDQSDDKGDAAAPARHALNAPALRISFTTDRPLFPYREPDMAADAAKLGAKDRLLRIYFLSNVRYQGGLSEQQWTGKVVWSNALEAYQCLNLHTQLALPEKQVALWWLTEFEDHWPYRPAPSDLYFSPSKETDAVIKRPDEVAEASYSGGMDVMPLVILGALVVPVWWTRQRRED